MCFTAPMAVNDHSRRLLLRTTSLQPPPAHLLDHGLEPGEERRRIRKVQCRATADRKKQMDLEHVEQPAPALQRRCSPNWPTWRAAVAAHIPTDCRLSDLETELEQFTMNVWGAPERGRPAHLANERAQFSRDLRSANMVARPLAPIRSKPSAAPANDALLPDNRNRAQDGRKQMITKQTETDRYYRGAVVSCPPAKHVNLLP